MKIVIISLVILFVLSGCSKLEYKKADLGFYAGHEGYLDKEIKPGVHIIEVTQTGGYKDNSMLFIPYWKKRARELCPKGYDGEPIIIHATDAKIKEFYCGVRFCQFQKVASGIARCL